MPSASSASRTNRTSAAPIISIRIVNRPTTTRASASASRTRRPVMNPPDAGPRRDSRSSSISMPRGPGLTPMTRRAAIATPIEARANTTAGVPPVRTSAAISGPSRTPVPSTTPAAPLAAVSSSGVCDSDGSIALWVGRATTTDAAANAAAPYTRATGAAMAIITAVRPVAKACTTYPPNRTRWRGNRSPRPAAGGAASAAGTSWSRATMPDRRRSGPVVGVQEHGDPGAELRHVEEQERAEDAAQVAASDDPSGDDQGPGHRLSPLAARRLIGGV